MKLFGWKSAGRAVARPLLSHGFSTWGSADWPRSYEAQLRELYLGNAVAQRAVRLVAEGVASAPLSTSEPKALALVSATSGGQSLLETVAMQLLLHGNAYVELLAGPDGAPAELFALRPERVSVEPDPRGWPMAFVYRAGAATTRLASDRVIHIRTHHPLDDHYGLGCLDAAAGAMAAHNAATRWNKALLDNAARPSGALVAEGSETLTTDQFTRLRQEMEESFSGSGNAGRPMLLEGGLRWQAMSLSPTDMDFAGLKAAAAREIALAFGVPPVLLGLPGDATYANYREANKALWRQAILPLAGKILDALAEGLSPWFAGLKLSVDLDQVPALSEDRERLWAQVNGADFLSLNEKRVMLGFVPQPGPRASERVEVKFNPWHDPTNGRFTFRQGGSLSAGGGSFGGGGATGRFKVPPRPKPVVSVPQPSPSTAHKTPSLGQIVSRSRSATDRMHRITENGYAFDLDSEHRTRRAGGTVRLDPGQRRSRSAQRRAGVPDRLPSDEGGHYVAREFGGPDKDFNHFAQDANFNRSGYRKLENKWQRLTKAGKKVTFAIIPQYPRGSRRPSAINVMYFDGKEIHVKNFPNGQGR
ncbi:MAG: phage portal protein [Sphingomonadales bacterium]|nr:phage portal protein [Sphingomonadales bacterium]